MAITRAGVVLAMLAAPTLAHATPLRSHVLADRVIHDRRVLTVVVERDRRCIDPTRLEADPPFLRTAKSRCVVELVGPTDAMPSLKLAGEQIPPAWRILEVAPEPTRTIDRSLKGQQIELVAASPLPIGRDAVAAYLFASNDGQPTSDIELNVVADGARPRALRWVRPGVATIELFVAEWRPEIEIVAQHGDAAARSVVAVDPGPPTEVALELPVIELAVPFAVTARVTTTGGVPVPPERVRVDAIGCEHRGSALACMTVRSVDVVVEVESSGDWIPIEVRPVSVIALVRELAREPRLGWELAMRGGLAMEGGWAGGPVGFLTRPLTPWLSGIVGVAWEYQRHHYDGLSPVSGRLDLSEHDFDVVGGVRAEIVRGVPWTLRVLVGPSVAQQRGALDGNVMSSTALRGIATITAGVRSGTDRLAIGFDLGARIGLDVVSPAWQRATAELVMEVSVVVRR